MKIVGNTQRWNSSGNCTVPNWIRSKVFKPEPWYSARKPTMIPADPNNNINVSFIAE